MSAIGTYLIILLIVTVIPASLFAFTYRPISPGLSAAMALSSMFGIGFTCLVPCLGSFTWSLIPAGLITTTWICSLIGMTRKTAMASIVAAAVAIDLGFGYWWSTIIFQINHQLQKHPVISLADRLEYERAYRKITDFEGLLQPFPRKIEELEIWRFPTADGIKNDDVTSFENLLIREHTRQNINLRNFSFMSLLRAHHSIESQFTRATGFGFERTMLLRYQDWVIDLPEPKTFPLPSQPGCLSEEDDFADASAPGVDYRPWHEENLINFVNLSTWGYVAGDWKSRRPDLTQVVGFRPHAFGSEPKPPATSDDEHAPWRIDALSLVSLLKHSPPAVYVSDHLPDMHELERVPTRPLDEFEAGAIQALRSKGEELVVIANSNHLRMVGSIRAAVQCLQCHQVPRGTLLGAFSYRLSRLEPPVPMPDDD